MGEIPTTILKTSTAGAFNIWKWLWKHKYIILILFTLIPTLIVSINVAKETNNPSYPFIQAGVSIINSDSVLYEDIKLLETNPSQIIGMVKPTIGLWEHIKYFFKVVLVVWALLGLLSIITLPFFFLYYLFDKMNTATKTKTFFRALFTFIIAMFIINLIIVVVKQASGNIVYTFDPSLNFYGKAGQVISWVLPLHGVWELGKYMVLLLS